MCCVGGVQFFGNCMSKQHSLIVATLSFALWMERDRNDHMAWYEDASEVWDKQISQGWSACPLTFVFEAMDGFSQLAVEFCSGDRKGEGWVVAMTNG